MQGRHGTYPAGRTFWLVLRRQMARFHPSNLQTPPSICCTLQDRSHPSIHHTSPSVHPSAYPLIPEPTPKGTPSGGRNAVTVPVPGARPPHPSHGCRSCLCLLALSRQGGAEYSRRRRRTGEECVVDGLPAGAKAGGLRPSIVHLPIQRGSERVERLRALGI